jgi:hypothetical protein
MEIRLLLLPSAEAEFLRCHQGQSEEFHLERGWKKEKKEKKGEEGEWNQEMK